MADGCLLQGMFFPRFAKHSTVCTYILNHCCCCSVMSDSAISRTAACQASLSFTISQSLLKLMPIELMMPSIHLILCWPLLLLPSIFPSIGVFSNESALHTRWPKYWIFSFSISPSNEYSGLISFRTDWFKSLSRVFSGAGSRPAQGP